MTAKPGGYLLPVVMDPEDTRCVILRIPDDQNHVAAFWGQMQTLARHYAWARDTLKQGKEAAAIWQDVIDTARTEWDLDMCPIDVRQNTANPCLLEKTEDGGATWEPFAILSDCTSGKDGDAPFQGGSGSAGTDSAANAANWIDGYLCLIVQGIAEAKSDTQIIAEVSGYVAAFVPNIQAGLAIQETIDALRALTVPQRSAFCGGDLPDDLYQDAVCNDRVDPEDGSWLDNWTEWITSALNGWAQDVVDALNNLADLVGIGDQNFISRQGGSGGGASFGEPLCWWCFRLPFAQPDPDWGTWGYFAQPIGYATHANYGWRSGKSFGQFKFAIRRDFGDGSRTIKKVQLTMNSDADWVPPETSEGWEMYFRSLGQVEYLHTFEGWPAAGEHSWTWELEVGVPNIDSIGFQQTPFNPGTDGSDGHVHLTELHVWYAGDEWDILVEDCA